MCAPGEMWQRPPQPVPIFALAPAPPPPPSPSPPPSPPPPPRIAQLNVLDNSRMHIGPSFVSVAQTVRAAEVVEDVGLARYVWNWARRTSRAERLACVAALAALALCVVLVGAFAAPAAAPPRIPDIAPHPWNITRLMWLASAAPDEEEPWPADTLPLQFVIVQHTAGLECRLFADCAAVMRNMQNYYFKEYHYDIPYNFVVGNDGRVYEGRGWSTVGAHTRGLNRCALGLGFAGDYRPEGGARVSAAQLEGALALLSSSVAAGLLDARYRVLAACDVQSTASPGANLYRALSQWPHFVSQPAAKRFRDATCEDIFAAERRP